MRYTTHKTQRHAKTQAVSYLYLSHTRSQLVHKNIATQNHSNITKSRERRDKSKLHEIDNDIQGVAQKLKPFYTHCPRGALCLFPPASWGESPLGPSHVIRYVMLCYALHVPTFLLFAVFPWQHCALSRNVEWLVGPSMQALRTDQCELVRCCALKGQRVLYRNAIFKGTLEPQKLPRLKHDY